MLWEIRIYFPKLHLLRRIYFYSAISIIWVRCEEWKEKLLIWKLQIPTGLNRCIFLSDAIWILYKLPHKPPVRCCHIHQECVECLKFSVGSIWGFKQFTKSSKVNVSPWIFQRKYCHLWKHLTAHLTIKSLKSHLTCSDVARQGKSVHDR